MHAPISAKLHPDVVQKLRILMISPDIPNDTLSFGPDFPADVRATLNRTGSLC
jgi:ABC-type phosphate/phosphonate transport system substrate-binding protein